MQVGDWLRPGVSPQMRTEPVWKVMVYNGERHVWLQLAVYTDKAKAQEFAKLWARNKSWARARVIPGERRVLEGKQEVVSESRAWRDAEAERASDLKDSLKTIKGV